MATEVAAGSKAVWGPVSRRCSIVCAAAFTVLIAGALRGNAAAKTFVVMDCHDRQPRNCKQREVEPTRKRLHR